MSKKILIHPQSVPDDPDFITGVTRQQAGWEHLSLQLRQLQAGQQWKLNTGPNELVFIVLSGCYTILSNQGAWAGLDRMSIFSGPGYVVYFSHDTEFTILAERSGEFALVLAPTNQHHHPFMIQPENIHRSVQGNSQTNTIISASSVMTQTQNFVISETVVVGELAAPETSFQLESATDGLYLFKFEPSNQSARQQIYTSAQSQATTVYPEHNDIVLAPQGHQTAIVTSVGKTYRLNVIRKPATI